jgi:two-component system, cell cycle response regulator CpdR
MTASDASVAPPGFTARILVVDDEDVICNLTRGILEDHSYHVLTSRDGPAALDVARRAMVQPGSTVHLVLIDVDMPGMNGYALGRLLALTWPALPIVYMSGPTVGLAGRESLGGSEHVIAKPFSEDELLTTVRVALRVAAYTCDSSQQGTAGDPGTLGYESIAAARAAHAAVAYLDEDARWGLLQKWLVEEAAGPREAGKRSLRLEALRSIVCPRVSDREWNRVVREHWPVRWADQLRLANALAARRSDPPLARKAREAAVGQSRGQARVNRSSER